MIKKGGWYDKKCEGTFSLSNINAKRKNFKISHLKSKFECSRNTGIEPANASFVENNFLLSFVSQHCLTLVLGCDVFKVLHGLSAKTKGFS
jgi:hypothetical protein